MNRIFRRNEPFALAARESRGRSWILELLIFFAVFLTAGAAEGVVLVLPEMAAIFSSDAFENLMISGRLDLASLLSLLSSLPVWFTVVSLFATAALIAIVILYCRILEKRSLRSMGILRERAVPEYLWGLLTGLALFSLAALIARLSGSVRFSLSAERPAGLLILLFAGYMVQGMSEEVACRGYFCVSVSRRSGTAAAVFLSSAVFALLHLANPGLSLLAVVNLFLFGVFAALWFIWRGSIWGAAAIHAMWNFAEGCLYGVSVSGTGAGPSLLACSADSGRSLWNGGAFGLEGGLAVTIPLCAAIAALCVVLYRRGSVRPAAGGEEAAA